MIMFFVSISVEPSLFGPPLLLGGSKSEPDMEFVKKFTQARF